MTKKTTTLDELLEDLKFDFDETEEKLERKCVALWLSEDYKIKYDDLQRKTKMKFGKKSIELMKAFIDKAHAKAI